MPDPDEHPIGQTQYKNYDPERINSVEDAVELFRWISGENEAAGNAEAAGAFRDCADLLENEVVE